MALVLGMALSLSAQNASAQSLKDRFKKVAVKVGKQAKETVVHEVKTTAKPAAKTGKLSLGVEAA